MLQSLVDLTYLSQFGFLQVGYLFLPKNDKCFSSSISSWVAMFSLFPWLSYSIQSILALADFLSHNEQVLFLLASEIQ